MKRTLLVHAAALWAAAAAMGALLPLAAQAAYPERVIRIVVPYAPGGAADILARALAEKLSPRLGQPVLVDNKTGASGNIGIDAVAKAPADGYTISFALSSNLMINQYLFKKLPYDPQKDLALLAKIADAPIVRVVNSSLPIANAADLRKYVASNKGRLSYGSWGVGTISHLSASRLYATGAQATQFIAAGRLKAIGVTGTSRLPNLPNVPTLAEAGLDDPLLRAVGWIGFAAPAGTPKPVMQRLAQELEAAMKLPDVQQR